MNCFNRVLMSAVAVAGLSLVARGTTYYVSPTGDGTAPTAGFATGFSTIKAALANEALADGDTILLDTCTFDMGKDGGRGDISKKTDAINKRVVISGAGKKEETILDGGREWDRRNSGQDAFYPQFYVNANGVIIQNMTLERMGSNGDAAIEVVNGKTDCVISNIIVRNTGWGYTTRGGQKGHFNTGNQNTKVTCCIFTNNCCSCALVSMTGGAAARLENCYFADNTCTGWSNGTAANGVVHATFGQYEGQGWFRNNTIVNNKSLLGALCHDNYVACRIVNNIVYGNTDLDGKGPKDVYQKSSYVNLWTYNCIGEGGSTYTGAGNIFANPNLADDNLHLKASSLCVGAGSATYATAYDIEGVARDAEKPCMGCSEFVGSTSFTCEIGQSAAPLTFVSQPTKITLHATVSEGAVAPLTYAWDLNGDGVTDTDDPEPVLSEIGEYPVSVVITDANSHEASAALTDNLCIYPAEKVFYVVGGENPNARAPYASWETAATSVNAAYAHALKFSGSQILLSNGVHEVTATLVLTNAMRLTSVNGRDVTVLKRTNLYGDQSMVSLNDPDASVDGFAFAGPGLSKILWAHGVGVLVNSGTLRDCILTNFCNNAYGVVKVAASNIDATRPAVVDRCVIADNADCNVNSVVGIYFSGKNVTIENCLVRNNVATKSGSTVFRNDSYATVVRNCTFVDNHTLDKMPVFFQATPTVVENVIVSGCMTNNGASAANDVLIYDLNKKVYAGVLSALRHSCVYPALADYSGNENVITVDPQFVGTGDAHLRLTSPCVNAGTNSVYTAASVDLDGKPRVNRRKVDLGCYESQYVPGFGIVIR